MAATADPPEATEEHQVPDPAQALQGEAEEGEPEELAGLFGPLKGVNRGVKPFSKRSLKDLRGLIGGYSFRGF